MELIALKRSKQTRQMVRVLNRYGIVDVVSIRKRRGGLWRIHYRANYQSYVVTVRNVHGLERRLTAAQQSSMSAS